MARREYTGNANYLATLNADITNASSSLTLNSGGGTGFPTGASGNVFFLVIDPGTANEEKVTATSRSGDTISGLTRGQDNTSAVAHLAGVKVQHVWTATDANDVNAHAFDTTRDDHTQYVHNSTARIVSAAHSFTGGPTFSTVAPTLSAGVKVTGAVNGAYNSELAFTRTNAADVVGISTASTGAPALNFAHRGTSNTGSWAWQNGTNAATTQMSLSGAGVLSALGSTNNFGAGALGASGTYVNIGSQGSSTSAGMFAGGTATDLDLLLRAKGAGNIRLQGVGGNDLVYFDNNALASLTTCMTLTYHNGTSGVTQRVNVGAANSGGAGQRLLSVPN